MCSPVALAGVTGGVQAASSVFGFMGQNQAAKLNTQAANLGYANNINALNTQATQINQQQSENTVSSLIDSVAARGRISAAAGSEGAGGSSTASQMNAAEFSAGRNLAVEDLNSQNARVQNANQRSGADLQRRSQIASVQPASPLSLVLGLANAGISGAKQFSEAGGQF
jgi:hypothetical protein